MGKQNSKLTQEQVTELQKITKCKIQILNVNYIH
jgi:hypothetical protein